MMEKRFPKFLLLIAFTSSMMALSFLCTSCSQFRDIDPVDPFRVLYGRSSVSPVFPSSQSKGFPSLTLSCHMMPLPLFCRILSDKFSVGMVFSESLSSKVVTAEFKDTDFLSVLNVLSRQLSVDVVRVGNTFFIGSLRPEDRAILVRRVFGYESSELSSLVSSMLSTSGKSSVLSNSVVICADHESVIRRVSEMFDIVDSVDSPTWILQLCFVLLRKDALIESGLNVKSSGTISYNISESKLDFKDFSLDGFFNLTSNSSFADLYAAPMLLLRDGVTGSWKDGKRVPIPRTTVSDQGTVTVTGYDWIDSGLIVSATVRQSRKGGRVVLSVEKSDISSYVGDAPVTTQCVFSTDVDLEPLRPYLVGELSQVKYLDTQKEVLTLGRDRGKVSIQVWAQLYKIRGTSMEKFRGTEKKSSD